MNKKAIIAVDVLITLAVVVGVMLYVKFARQDAVPQKKLVIATTNFPLYDLARTIGGDRVEVRQLLPGGSSPHTFEPTPATIGKLAGAHMVLIIGHGFDAWADALTKNVGTIPVHNLTKDMTLRLFPDGSADPHYWLSLRNHSIMSKNLTGLLSDLDPASAPVFRQNHANYLQSMNNTNKTINELLMSIPDKKIATFHEAWYYFAADYDITIATSFEEFPGKEPTAPYLAEFVKTVKNERIKAVFAEPQFSSASIEQVAKDLKVKLHTINPMDGSGSEHDTYFNTMIENAKTIAEALSN